MATLNDYFRTEAREFLTALERGLTRTPAPDAAELHRAVRGLRGTAQMAREQRVFDVVTAFESVTRSLATGALAWSDHVAGRARETIADLRALVDASEDDERLDTRVSAAAARWSEAGEPPPPSTRAAQSGDEDMRAFREFTAREAAGIADAIDRGMADLHTDPMDREPLRAILRRQRALLGAARLDEVPVVAEILRAIEDLTRVIAKLDVGVKQEWLDIYRVARDALQTTIAPLLRDEQPPTSHAVSRLRHMREELLERYGSGEDQSPAHDALMASATTVSMAPQAAAPRRVGEPQHMPPPIAPFMPRGSAPAAAPAPTPSATAESSDTLEVPHDDEVLELGEDSIIAPDVQEPVEAEVSGDVIEIDALAYTSADALDRALELYDVIARGVAQDAQARDAVEELFDLIRIARSER